MIGIYIRRACIYVMSLGAILGFATQAQAEWYKAESRHFILYSNAGKSLTSQYINDMEAVDFVSDDGYRIIGDADGTPVQKPVFYLLGKLSDFQTVRSDEYADTMYITSPCEDGDQYFSVMHDKRSIRLGELDDKIDTNLGHLLYSADHAKRPLKFSGDLPYWVRIGLANFYRTAVVDKDKVILGRPPENIAIRMTSLSLYNKNTDDLSNGQFYFPLADLVAGKPFDWDHIAVARFESWVLVHHLMTDPVLQKKFADYLSRVTSGVPSAQAFSEAFGVSPETFRPLLWQYAKVRVATETFALQNRPDPQITITELKAYRDPVPLLYAATKMCVAPSEGDGVLTRLKRLYAEYPEDRLSALGYARAEILYGDAAKARSTLQIWLSKLPDDAEVNQLYGKMLLTLAENGTGPKTQNYAEARKALARAYKLDPGSPTTLYYFAKAHADQPDYPNANTLNAVKLANNYRGGDTFLDYRTELLVRQGKYDEALPELEAEVIRIHPDFRKALRTRLEDVIAAVKAKAPVEDVISRLTAYRTQWQLEK